MGGARILLLGLLGTVFACRSVSAPPDDRPFAEGAACARIEGCFTDRGVAASGEPVPRLSLWLWPEADPDESITEVRFDLSAEGASTARAFAGGTLARERELPRPASAGHEGPIRLGGGTWFPPFTSEGGEPAPLVGTYSEKIELGVDASGDLVARRSGRVFGLVYLLIPVVFFEDTRVRFERVPCPWPDFGRTAR